MVDYFLSVPAAALQRGMDGSMGNAIAQRSCLPYSVTARDKQNRERWHCMSCGQLSSIGDKPVRNHCRCADVGD